MTAELAGDYPEWAGVRAMLIRPDGYIAWATHADDAPPLATWLGSASLPPTSPSPQAVDTLRALLANQSPGSHLWLTLTEFGVVACTLATALFRRIAGA